MTDTKHKPDCALNREHDEPTWTDGCTCDAGKPTPPTCRCGNKLVRLTNGRMVCDNPNCYIVKPGDKPTTPYGLCPVCGSPGLFRERRPDGNDSCENGHVYPSRTANMGTSHIPTPPEPTEAEIEQRQAEFEGRAEPIRPEGYAPADAEVWEARGTINGPLYGDPACVLNLAAASRTILAALDKAQGEVEAEQNYSRDLCNMILRVTETETECPEDGWRVDYLEEELGEWLNWSIKEATDALRAENARLVEESKAWEAESSRLLSALSDAGGIMKEQGQKNAAQAEQIKRRLGEDSK